MSNQFLQRRRPRWLYVLAAGAGLIVMVAAGLVVQTALTPRPKESTTPPAAMPAPGAATAVGAGAFTPLHGSKVIDGVSVGYPHTLAGAVSAAVEYWSQIGSTLDPGRAEAIGKVIADPSWPHAAAKLREGPVSARHGLGLPTSGAVPQGASVVLTPVEYQVRDSSAGQAMVLLLGYYATTLPGQASQTRIGVYPLDLHWDGTDWKALGPDTTTDYSDLEAQPGSAQASADGWHPLAQ
jgi:hypothetical protein